MIHRPIVTGVADHDDVRRIALSLPETFEEEGRFAFSVRAGAKAKGIVWVWLERVEPERARVPNPDVIAIRVADRAEKEMLLASEPDVFFTEPHYDGYPAILVRLDDIDVDELTELITDAWRVQAPKNLVRAFDQRVEG
jgi:hypothetical protein